MRLSISILIFASALIGCTSSYNISSRPYGDGVISYSEFSENAKDESADILFSDGNRLLCKNIVCQSDSTSYINLTTNSRVAVPNDKIKKIIFTNRFLGILEGTGIGLLAGGGGGYLVGDNIGSNQSAESRGWGRLIFTVLGGTVGLVSGIVAGASEGHTFEYEFEKPSVTENSLPAQPAVHDDTHKKELYETTKKNSTSVALISMILPSAGHASVHQWNRGLLFASGRVGGVVYAYTFGVNNIAHKGDLFYVGIAVTVGFTIWEMMDVSDEVGRYNDHLHKTIFGETPVGLNIVPSKNGPQFQLSYTF